MWWYFLEIPRIRVNFDVSDEFTIDGIRFEIGKSLVIAARKGDKIIAIRPVLHYFHAENIVNKLQKDAEYRKHFLEKYKLAEKKHQ